MSKQTSKRIRRLVVALDASPYSRALLRTTARIAAGLDAKLEGIYVEDVDLIRVAEVSITQEVLVSTRMVRSFERISLERDYRALSREMEAWASSLLRALDVDWQFRVVRGNVAEQLMAAAGEEDLLCIGRMGRPLVKPPTRLGSVARAILRQHEHPLLLLEREIEVGQPILVVFNGTAECGERLRIGAQLAQMYQSVLIAVLPTVDVDEARQMQEQCNDLLVGQDVQVVYRRADPARLEQQIGTLWGLSSGTLLSRRMAGLEETDFALILL